MNTISLRFVIPPANPDDIIYRQALCEKLFYNRNKSLILINTSAGYGKTVLLSDYSGRFLKNTCWLNSPHDITTPNELTHYLIYSFRQIKENFGEAITGYITSAENIDKKKLCNEMVLLLLNEFIKSFDEEITFIIDDFQNLEENNNSVWIQDFFDELFTSLPGNLKFIVSTRQTPGFKISRLEAKRNYFALNTRDLEFTEHEIITLAHEVYQMQYSVQQAAELRELSHGWITILHLIVQSINTIEELSSYQPGENIYNYFAEDIFSYFDEEIRSFLIGTSFLDYFTVDFCNRLLNIKNAEKLINKIIAGNIFIDSFVKNDITFFCYQKLFSNFLNELCGKSLAVHEITNKYFNAAIIYEKSGDNATAIPFYIKSGNNIEAVRIINNDFEQMLKKSEYKILNDWFGLLSENVIDSDSTLLYSYLKFCVTTNQIEKIKHEKIDFLIVSNTSNDEKNFKYNLLKAEYLLISGNTLESMNMIEEISNNKLKGKISADYFSLIIRIYYRMGFDYYEKLIQTGEKALESINENGSIKQKQEVISYLANVHFHRGDHHIAIKYYLQALNLEKNILLAFKIFPALTILYSETGNFEKARENFKKGKECFDSFPIPLFERVLLRAEKRFYFNLGDFEATIVILEESVKNSAVNENQLLMLSSLWSITETYYYANKKDLANQNYELSLRYLDKSDNYFKEMNTLYKYYYTCSDITNVETENSLLSLIDLHIQKKIFHFLAPLQYYLSNHYLLSGKPETSLEYLQKAMKTFSEKNELVWCSNELMITRHVFDFAIANNVYKPFIKEVFRFTKEKLDYLWLSPAFRKELEEKIEKLTDLRLLSFGTMDFYLRGNLVHEDKWIRKKSKIILAYLLTHPTEIISKDMVIDLFFDDIPADKVDVVYHSTIYNIRTALKIYDLKSDAPKRSKQKPFDYNPQYLMYEDKTLRLNHDFYYKSDNIEFEELYSKFKVPGTSAEDKIKFAEEAVRLYKGDFLPGYYDNWCEEMRINYKNIYSVLCEGLVREYELMKNYDKVIEYALLILNQDKLNENAYISIISAYTNQNNINMAKNRFSSMLNIFEEELGEKPSAKTLQKIKTILDI